MNNLLKLKEKVSDFFRKTLGQKAVFGINKKTQGFDSLRILTPAKGGGGPKPFVI